MSFPNGKPTHKSHPAFRLALIVCLTMGLAASLAPAEHIARADDPPPSVEEGNQDIPSPASPILVGDAPLGNDVAELRAGLAALEAARQAGPQAVVALLDVLQGQALDLGLDEIVEAQLQLARVSQPVSRSAGRQVNLAEEESAQLARLAREAANRARALALPSSSAEGGGQFAIHNLQVATSRAPAVELTVGVGCTYTTIADAIAAASPGDTLLIEGGRTFTENLTIPISLTLRGGYNGCASLSAARSTIDGGAIDRVIVVSPGLSVTLENLDVTNGGIPTLDGGGIWFAAGGSSGTLNLNHVDIYSNTAYWGGGLWVGPNAEVIGTDVEIYSNAATSNGGGLRLYGGRATFSNASNIHHNSARFGAGVSGILQDGFTPTLALSHSTDIYNNQALIGAGLGGGIHMQQGNVWLADRSDIRSNDAIQGGGVYLLTSTLTIVGSTCEIRSNTATGDGGGVYAQGSTVDLDDEAELYSNRAGTGGTGYGGGAYLDDSELWGDKASIHYNRAADGGGGVYATHGSLLDMDLGGYPCTGPRCSNLSYNTATNEWGGGVEAYDSEVDLRQTFVEDNTTSYGGGVYARDSALYLYDVLLAGNSGGSADGIRLYDADLYGSENTLAFNPADGTGMLVATYGTSSLTLARSIVWGHATGLPTGQTVTCSDVQGGYAGVDNLDVDPLFVDPASSNFHLQSLSPAIDRCTGGLTVDFDNDPRPLIHIRPATPYDMGADEAAARVGINGAGCAYGRIQDAVDAASPGDTIQAASDTYTETVDITKTLTVLGGYDLDCMTYVTSTTTVDGDGAASVFDVTGNALVTLRDLAITGGDASMGGGVDVRNGAQVTLENSDVFGNQAGYGGGVYVDAGCTVTLTDDSDVWGNAATMSGGGARVWGALVGAETLSDITDNTAPDGGGVAVMGGTLILNGSDMSGNQANGPQGRGGGVYVASNGVVTLTASAFVYNGNTAYDGAGIYADNARVYMQGSNVNVSGNVATHNGGGLYLNDHSTLHAVAPTSIGYSSSGNEAVYGAGIYALTSTVDFEGTIYNNLASTGGAGIYATASTITLTNAAVGGTGANQANRLWPIGYYGAGLYLSNGTHAVLSNTIVASNTFPATTTFTYGGGAYVTGGSVLTLTNSTVERHLAPSTTDGRGAGIYLSDATLTLDNSRVLSNTAGTAGGGVRLWNDSTLNMLGGSEMSFNHALNGVGGAIAAGNAPDINISDSTLRYNTAGTDGGAVYLSAGTLDFSGGWNVRYNSAGGNGGAIAVTGSGDADFVASSAPAYLGNNDAGANGGALYVGNSDTVELYALGSSLSLDLNLAGGDGGAAYAGSGGGFDVRGRLRAGANSAYGNGGAFYLGGGSQLGLVAHSGDLLRFEVNYADNGGAIYAVGGSTVRCDGAQFGRTDSGGSSVRAGGSGGALYLSGGVLTSTNCLFRNNSAPANGGAIAAYTSSLTLDADYATCDPLVVQCSAIYSNTADSDGDDSGSGGGLYVNDSKLSVNHTTLYRNSAARGGAIYQGGASASAQVSNSLIYSNTVSVSSGSGIRTVDGVFTVTHTTIANNVGGAGYSQASTDSVVHNSIAWGNEVGGFQGTFVITACNIDQSGRAGPSIDPQFVAAGSGEDYHLQGASPAVDACETGLSPDLDGVLRPVAGKYDLGAYEYAYGIAFAPDRAGFGLPGSELSYTHRLTNTGGVADTYALAAHSGQGWSTAVTPTPTVTLDGGESRLVTVTLSVPAGTLSGTVDTLLVTATSSADPALAAAVTDTTAIGFAPGVALAPDGITTDAEAGHTYTYTHWLTNTGNHTDTFELVFASSAAWGTLLDAGPFTLGAGMSTTVRVSVSVPYGGVGQIDTSVVTATSQGGAGPAAVHDITSAFVPGVEFAPDYTQTVPVETVVTYTHQLTNTGNSTDTFALAWSTSRGWGELLDSGPFTLTQNATRAVRVRVQTPSASGGLTETTALTVTSAGGAGPAVVRDTTSTFTPGLALTPDYTDVVQAGESIIYTHRLTNTGEYTDTFDLALSADLNWATLLDSGPFTLATGGATDLRVRVDVPLDAGGLTNTVQLEASSQAGSISAVVVDTIIVVRSYGLALVPDHVETIYPGEVVTYTHWLTNTGSGADTVTLALGSSRGWASLLDPGPFDLLAGMGITVRVRVVAPAGSGGLSEISQLQATSQLSPTVQAFATDTTASIYIPSLSLTPDYAQSVAPGTLLTYTHWLTNTGNGADQFNLNWDSRHGWAIVLDLGPHSLEAGEGIGVQVRVSVPAGSGGLVDTAFITATAQSGGLSASVTDVTTATHAPGVQLVPDRAATALPGQVHIYTHTLSNSGNGPDTFTMTVISSHGWASLVDPGPFGLNAGEDADVRVEIGVPFGSGGLVETISVTAVSQADPGVHASVLDTVTVVYSATVSRTDILSAGVYTFGDTCAKVSFASDADRGELTAVTVTLVYSYPTGQLTARPLPRRYTIEGDRSSGFSATLSLCYLDAEWMFVGIEDETALQLYRYAGVPTWEAYSSTVDTAGNHVVAEIHAFSPWAIGAPGHDPTAVGLKTGSLKAMRVPGGSAGWLIAILGAGLLCLAGWRTLRRWHPPLPRVRKANDGRRQG